MENELNKKEKQDLINLVPFWWHAIDFGDGVVSKGWISSEIQKLILDAIPKNLENKNVLDIGTWDGFYAFECEKRGAKVTAIDNNLHKKESQGFLIAKKLLGSNVEYFDMDFFDAPEILNRKFDVVLFFGILYHLKNPLLALETLYKITNDMLILESHCIKTNDQTPMARFYPGNELADDDTNWWGPNIPAIIAMLETAGFKKVEVVSEYDSSATEGRVIIKAYKYKNSLDGIVSKIKIQIAEQREVINDENNINNLEKKTYRIKDLLGKHSNGLLLNNLYQTILKRNPDSDGYRYYLKQLEERSMEPTEVLGKIRYSAEGKRHQIRIRHLKIIYLLYRTRRMIVNHLPFLMPIIDLIFNNLKKSKYLIVFKQKINNFDSEVDQIGNKNNNFEYEIPEELISDFTNKFRGESGEIEKRLEIYLPHIKKTANRIKKNLDLLDLGCGRGEWLNVLKNNGYSCLGIDQSDSMIKICQTKELFAIQDNLFNFLKKQRLNCFDVITGFHIIEHFLFQNQLKMLKEINRVLRPGGLTIIETPNPENLVVAGNYFYIDPTHQRPVPPPLLEFLFSQSNFINLEIIRLCPSPSWQENSNEIERLIRGPRDYAILGEKPMD